jgi:hypothetical protein
VPNSSSWQERLCFNDNAHTVVVSWYKPPIGNRRQSAHAAAFGWLCSVYGLGFTNRARSARANARNPPSSNTHKVAVRIIRVPSNEDRTRFKQTRTLFDFVRAPFDSSRDALQRPKPKAFRDGVSLSLRNALHREPWHDLTLNRASDTAFSSRMESNDFWALRLVPPTCTRVRTGENLSV